MSVHVRVKTATNEDIIKLKGRIGFAYSLVIYSIFTVCNLLGIYALKSAFGIDIFPGWSLFH